MILLQLSGQPPCLFDMPQLNCRQASTLLLSWQPLFSELQFDPFLGFLLQLVDGFRREGGES